MDVSEGRLVSAHTHILSFPRNLNRRLRHGATFNRNIINTHVESLVNIALIIVLELFAHVSLVLLSWLLLLLCFLLALFIIICILIMQLQLLVYLYYPLHVLTDVVYPVIISSSCPLRAVIILYH